MGARSYLLALVVGSLDLLAGPRCELAAAQADPPPPAAGVTKPVPPVKPAPRRPIRPELRAVMRSPGSNRVATAIAAAAIVFAPAVRSGTSPAPPPRQPYLERRPYLDLEGLLLGDIHFQPNIMFETDGRYNNSSTRERAQREELDFLAARQHGESRGEDPISKMLRTHDPVIPGNNDPGFGVATDVRQKLETPPLPPRPAVQNPVSGAVKPPRTTVPRPVKR